MFSPIDTYLTQFINETEDPFNDSFRTEKNVIEKKTEIEASLDHQIEHSTGTEAMYRQDLQY
jgi:hypothetical protein